ncbi:hypothetical protein GT354_10135 [Streptomyces sp. SID3343]|nr:hypothetical protein [Streptomyces sp. SID3343]
MRRPVGHLPSTVYWRRRVVVLLALALLIALVAFACSRGGDSDKKKNTAGGGNPTPSTSGTPAPGAITPGANPTTGANPPPITGGASGTPGVPGTGSTPGATGGQTGGAANQPGGQPGGQTAGQPGGQPGANTAGNGGTVPGVPGGGKAAPAGGQWCTPAMIRVQVQSVDGGKTAYVAGQKMSFKLMVTNQTGPTCYIDFGIKSAYVEVFSGSDRYWSSADCAANPVSDVRQLQAGDTQQWSNVHDWSWTRSNAAGCASGQGQTPISPAPVAGAGFYAKGMLAGLEPSGAFRFTVAGK